MRKLIFPLVLVVAAVVLSALITSWVITKQAKSQGQFRAGVLEMKMEFLRNNSVLRPITDVQQRPDLQKYLQEVNTLVGWYFKNPASDLWQQYPDRYDPESIIEKKRQMAEEEGTHQRVAKGNLPIWEECYELTRGIYDQFKQANYTAVASGFEGSVRFDAHKVTREGNKLKWVVVVWGGIGPIVWNGWHMRWYKSPTEEERTEYEKHLAWSKKRGREPEMKDPATLHYAESQSASGQPVLPEFEGADYIVDFPPGARINYFYTPPCPPDAEKLEMEFRIKSRSISGQDQHMSFKFMVPVDSSWKGSWDGVQKIEAASDY